MPLKPSVETLQQQIDGMKEAVRLLQAFADRTPTTSNVQGEVLALKELTTTQLAAQEKLFDKLNAQRDTYEKRIADIIAEQKSKDAALLSTQVDKLGITTGERLSAVEKNQYTTGGTASVRDPQLAEAMARMASTIDTLSKTGSKTEGRETGRGDIIGWIVAAVAVVGGLIVIFAKFSV